MKHNRRRIFNYLQIRDTIINMKMPRVNNLSIQEDTFEPSIVNLQWHTWAYISSVGRSTHSIVQSKFVKPT